MVSGTQIISKYRTQSLIIIALTIIIALIIGLLSANFAAKFTKDDLRSKAQEILSIQVETLNGQLDKYRLLSVSLARRSDIEQLFLAPNNEQTANKAKQIAIYSAALSGALNIVFIRPNGKVIASGLGDPIKQIDPKSPMMIAALEGRLGREVNILHNNKRAYSFASAVRHNNQFVGVISVYVGLDGLEANWSLTKMPIFAVDGRGAIIMSNRPDLRLRSISEVSQKQNNFITLKLDNHKIKYIDYQKYLPQTGWQLYVLANSAPIRNAQLFWGLFSAFIVFIIGSIALILLNRQLQITQRARNERATSLRLERIVRDRTRQLTKTNIKLANEVEERKQTEEQLRKTQNELIQTGKLAALGQMSASLSHEYNQPLTATKTYAQNAIKYLELGRVDEAKSNIERISELADRMGEISKHLRNFARKPNISFGAIAINKVINDALEVMQAQIRAQNVQIKLDIQDENILVKAGHVRLQQVIVNLIANALDAMIGQKNAQIIFSLTKKKNKVMLSIIDNGRGIDEAIIDKIFDPFFSTKQVGEGLGLGLSISYNIIKDFGGSLRAENNKDKGANFTIILKSGQKAKR